MTSRNRIDTQDLGVLVVDMQPAFLQFIQGATTDAFHEAVSNTLHAIVSSSLPVALVEFNPTIYGSTSKWVRDQLPLSRQNIRRYVKPSGDAFTNRYVDLFLQSQGVRNILLIGLFATDCIHDTANSAQARGFSVFTRYPLVANPLDMGYENSWLTRTQTFREDYKKIIEKIKSPIWT